MLSNTKQSGSVYLSELNCCLQRYRKEISHLPCSLSSPLSSPIPFQLPKFIKPHLLIKPPALQMECNGWNFFFTHSLLTLRFQFSKRPWLPSSVSHSLPLKNVCKNCIWGGVEDTLYVTCKIFQTRDTGRFPFSQNFRNFWFGGKLNTFRRLVPLENSQKKWRI